MKKFFLLFLSQYFFFLTAQSYDPNQTIVYFPNTQIVKEGTLLEDYICNLINGNPKFKNQTKIYFESISGNNVYVSRGTLADDYVYPLINGNPILKKETEIYFDKYIGAFLVENIYLSKGTLANDYIYPMVVGNPTFKNGTKVSFDKYVGAFSIENIYLSRGTLANDYTRDGKTYPLGTMIQISETGQVLLDSIQITDDIILGGDEFQIENVSIENIKLIVNVKYSGGCKIHHFELFWNGHFQLSNPSKCILLLKHNANNDPCDGIDTETLFFDLSKITQSCKIVLTNSFDFTQELSYTFTD